MKDTKFYTLITAYGISHGIFTALGMYLTWRFIPILMISVAGFSVIYYYAREAKARGTYDIRQWYADSQWDAITPALVAVIGVYLVYLH